MGELCCDCKCTEHQHECHLCKCKICDGCSWGMEDDETGEGVNICEDCTSHSEETKRITTKNLQCVWCAETIEKGQDAVFRHYAWNSRISKDQMHPECFEAMGRIDPYEIEDGWMIGDFKRGSTEEG